MKKNWSNSANEKIEAAYERVICAIRGDIGAGKIENAFSDYTDLLNE